MHMELVVMTHGGWRATVVNIYYIPATVRQQLTGFESLKSLTELTFGVLKAGGLT